MKRSACCNVHFFILFKQFFSQEILKFILGSFMGCWFSSYYLSRKPPLTTLGVLGGPWQCLVATLYIGQTGNTSGAGITVILLLQQYIVYYVGTWLALVHSSDWSILQCTSYYFAEPTYECTPTRCKTCIYCKPYKI